ncbi:MAG: hypothetical protein V4484_11550 [Pseudomonadota bacterium]
MPAVENELNPAPFAVRTFGVSWPLLVAFLSFIAVLGGERVNAVLGDPDTYWHLATGRWMFEHGAVPHSDPFSHSMPGTAWTAHEWLSELALAGLFQVAGWAGLTVAVALVLGATLAYLMRFLLARMEPVHALLLTAFAGAMLASHLLARPHVLIWPVLAVWVGTLVNAAEQESGPPWLALPLMTLWANLHGSFTLGLALGVALALDAVLRTAPERRRQAAWRWSGFIGLSIAAVLLTPSGWHGLWYPIQIMNMKLALDLIGEWMSPNFHKLQMLEVWLLLILAIACSGRLRLPWLRLVLMLGLVHLALKHQRHLDVLGLVMPFLIAAPLALQWNATKGSAPDVEGLDRVFRALAAPARAGAIAASVVLTGLLIGMTLQSARFAPSGKSRPEAALQAAMRAGAAGPVLNAYNFGGYLIYMRVPVFIDGRADMYGDALLKRHLDALTLHDSAALPQLLDDYRIGWTMLEPGTPALALLDRMPGWKRVHADATAVVHVRERDIAAH